MFKLHNKNLLSILLYFLLPSLLQTNLSTFPASSMEVYRSQGDFQWLYSALQEVCPERIVPPLRPPISLDATISEFQRFLSRVSTHKTLSKHPFFIIFLSGTAKVRVIKKFLCLKNFVYFFICGSRDPKKIN